MKYAIVYSSVTGNTKKLAESIKDKINDCYFGNPNDKALSADTIFLGFWTTRNSCGEDIQSFLKKLSGKNLFIFGTAGYNNTKQYFEEILSNVKSHIPSSNTIIGTYMCQGKVSDTMQNKIKEAKPEMYEAIKDNLAESINHPNEENIKALALEIDKVINA